MNRLKVLYGSLCVASVLIGLYPSIFLNVKPFWTHDQTGMAAVQLILTLVTAAIPLIIFRLHWLEACIAGLLLLGLLRVSVANGIESVTLTRGEISSGREATLSSKTEWTTRIEKWATEKVELKARFIPTKGEKEYAPTGEDAVATAREGRDTVNRERDAACKVSVVSEGCKNLTARADSAQVKLEQVTQNYELTKRVDQLERDIREAQTKLGQAGVAPPDYFAQAKNALAGAWFDPLQDREAWLAYIAEGVAAFAPKFFVFLVSFLFTASLGEDWWRESALLESALLESPLLAPTPRPLASIPSTNERRKRSITTNKRLECVPGVQAWALSVTPPPGVRGQRYTPGTAYPFYEGFCKVNDYVPAPLPVFGSILKTECALIPAAVKGGSRHYEFVIDSKVVPLMRETA